MQCGEIKNKENSVRLFIVILNNFFNSFVVRGLCLRAYFITSIVKNRFESVVTT